MAFALNGMLARLLCLVAKVLTGARSRWVDSSPLGPPRVYYANHASHGDFVLLWACLPPEQRAHTRPVAGADYWLQGRLRAWFARKVLNAVLIAREKVNLANDPIAQMAAVLAGGDSLIVFPEGTRNTTDAPLLPFKSGLFHLAARCPDVEFLPVWIENSGRAMPKGALIPVPLFCTLTFGAPVRIEPGEQKAAFIERARARLTALTPSQD
jgi:1-acyl-sn-glycerol-3-phosphate acyltransferase